LGKIELLHPQKHSTFYGYDVGFKDFLCLRLTIGPKLLIF